MIKDGVFRKARASNPSGNCVEIAWGAFALPEGQVRRPEAEVAIRDSKDPEGPVLQFTEPEWEAFLNGLGNREFDLVPA